MQSETYQLLLFHLLVEADGKCSEEELERLEAIADTIDAPELVPVVRKIISERISDDQNRLESIINTINEFHSFGCPFTFSEEVFTLWTMISLGYADAEYSEAEKRVVNHVSELLEIDKNVISALIDSANTILDLEGKKAWVKTTEKSYDEITSIINDIDEDIKRVYSSVEAMISEADIE